MIKEQTLIPELLDVDLANSLKLYQSSTNYLDAVSEFVNELGIAIEWESTPTQNDPIQAQVNFFTGLNNLTLSVTQVDDSVIQTGLGNLTTSFLVYWTNKYDLALSAVQIELNSALGANNVYFKPISENIGMIGKYPNFVLDNSTIPYYVNALTENLIPWMYPGSVDNKLRMNSKCVSKTLSLRTNALLRANMRGLRANMTQDQNFVDQNAHGDNLVTDLKYWYTISEISVEILSQIATQFGDLYRLISFYSTYNPQDANLNKKVADKNGYKMLDAEGSQECVDLFKRKIKSLKSTVKTADRLSV